MASWTAEEASRGLEHGQHRSALIYEHSTPKHFFGELLLAISASLHYQSNDDAYTALVLLAT